MARLAGHGERSFAARERKSSRHLEGQPPADFETDTRGREVPGGKTPAPDSPLMNEGFAGAGRVM